MKMVMMETCYTCCESGLYITDLLCYFVLFVILLCMRFCYQDISAQLWGYKMALFLLLLFLLNITYQKYLLDFFFNV